MGELVGFSALNCIYFALLGIGIIYAVIILITGGLHDVDVPGLDIDVGDIDIGGHHLPEVPVHIDLDHAPSFDHGDVGVPSLSPVTIASFITAFGSFGLLAVYLFNVSDRFSLLWASGGGLVVAIIAHFAFGYFLIAPQGSSEVTARDIIGLTAEVITPISADGVGQVAFVAQGRRVTFSARSAGGAPVSKGTLVSIESFTGSVAVVRPQQDSGATGET
jgi:membrane protein implicated in regulation of membrane protease activity